MQDQAELRKMIALLVKNGMINSNEEFYDIYRSILEPPISKGPILEILDCSRFRVYSNTFLVGGNILQANESSYSPRNSFYKVTLNPDGTIAKVVEDGQYGGTIPIKSADDDKLLYKVSPALVKALSEQAIPQKRFIRVDPGITPFAYTLSPL
jgi:hypothetical protein